MPHQLMLSAKKKWRKVDGQNRLPEIIEGVEFRDGIKPESKARNQRQITPNSWFAHPYAS